MIYIRDFEAVQKTHVMYYHVKQLEASTHILALFLNST